jgi:predicted secreted protein
MSKSYSRRVFLKVTAISLGTAAVSMSLPYFVLAQEDGDTPFNFVQDPDNPTELEAEHIISIRLPVIAEDGSNVPVIASMANHPMEPDHYIKSFKIYNFTDPIVSKGKFEFTPANGQAYISTQARMDGGDANLYVVGECTQHGLWAAQATLKVSLGGC